MKPVKCSACQKYYDEDKYDICPHCKGEGGSKGIKTETRSEQSNLEAALREKSKSKWGFHSTAKKEKSKKEKSEQRNSGERQVSDTPLMSIRSHMTVPNSPEMDSENELKTNEEIHGGTELLNEDPFSDIYSDSGLNNSRNHQEFKSEPDPAAVPAVPVYEEPAPEMPEPENSLAAAVKNAGSVVQSSNDKTVAFYNFANDVEPVVGWIVCVEGEYKGEGFPLKSGRNNIGRSLNMDVALAKEKSVSRERHAVITFEPHQKKFFVQSGESSGLTYVNNEILMTFKELQDYDVIALGECKFVFVRLVNDRFSWDNYS